MSRTFKTNDGLREIWDAIGGQPYIARYGCNNWSNNAGAHIVSVHPWTMPASLPAYGVKSKVEHIDTEWQKRLFCFTFVWHTPYHVLEQYCDRWTVGDAHMAFAYPNYEFEDRLTLKAIKRAHYAEERDRTDAEIKVSLSEHVLITVNMYAWEQVDYKDVIGEQADYYRDRSLDK